MSRLYTRGHNPLKKNLGIFYGQEIFGSSCVPNIFGIPQLSIPKYRDYQDHKSLNQNILLNMVGLMKRLFLQKFHQKN